MYLMADGPSDWIDWMGVFVGTVDTKSLYGLPGSRNNGLGDDFVVVGSIIIHIDHST